MARRLPPSLLAPSRRNRSATMAPVHAYVRLRARTRRDRFGPREHRRNRSPIKLITRAGSEQARQRFLLEARAVARMRHPNVVVVHRVGFAVEQPYIAYDLVRGRTFRELRAPLPWPKVLELAAGAVRRLTAAHTCNVLHRESSPASCGVWPATRSCHAPETISAG